MAQSTDTQDGWMPAATKVSIPDTNYSPAISGRAAVVLHIIEGSASSALAEFKRVGIQKSSHFVVSKAGRIWQCVSVDDSAYANGLSWSTDHRCWVDPQGHLLTPPNPVPTWLLLQPPINPNLTTISIEREGYAQDVPTAAQDAAVVKIMQYCADRYPTLDPYIYMRSLIGHKHISPKSKPNCPGPYTDYARLAQAANRVTTYPATVIGLPVYQRSDRTGPLWGWLKSGQTVVIDDLSNGHVAMVDGVPAQIGFVDIAGLEKT